MRLPPNYALERSVRGLSERAAGAQNIIAPASRWLGLARPAQGGTRAVSVITIWLYSLPLLLIAGIVYWLMRRSTPWLRILVVSAIWPALPLGLSLWIVIVGDQMPPNAVLINPETLQERPHEP